MGHTQSVVKAKEEVIDVDVKNNKKENLGEINELMLDKVSGRVVYAVLDSGSFLGLGGKLFALPWNALTYDKDNKCFIVDIEKDRLKDAPGFDKSHWPDMADKNWGQSLSKYYGVPYYWE